MTQKELILEYINQHGSITPMEAFSELGITKLATVVSDLRRHDGIEFEKELEKSLNRFGKPVHYMRYSLR